MAEPSHTRFHLGGTCAADRETSLPPPLPVGEGSRRSGMPQFAAEIVGRGRADGRACRSLPQGLWRTGRWMRLERWAGGYWVR
jgi:hypothetical protein